MLTIANDNLRLSFPTPSDGDWLIDVSYPVISDSASTPSESEISSASETKNVLLN